MGKVNGAYLCFVFQLQEYSLQGYRSLQNLSGSLVIWLGPYFPYWLQWTGALFWSVLKKTNKNKGNVQLLSMTRQLQ